MWHTCSVKYDTHTLTYLNCDNKDAFSQCNQIILILMIDMILHGSVCSFSVASADNTQTPKVKPSITTTFQNSR